MGGAVYQFGQYALDADRRRLSRGGQQVDVESRALELLCLLVEHRDRVVSEDELRDRTGRGRTVSETALAAWLRTARLAIGDSDTGQQLIRTVSPHSHRFVVSTTVLSSTPISPPAAAPVTEADHEVIRFCRSVDGTRIAYALTGEGPPLVKTANWLTHLDLDRTNPMWAHWFDGLTRGRQLIRYDERGCGLSELFIMIGGLIDTGVIDEVSNALADAIGTNELGGSLTMLGASAVLSGGVDNIPYVATMAPITSDLVHNMGGAGDHVMWWALALGADLGGNATAIGPPRTSSSSASPNATDSPSPSGSSPSTA